MRKFLKSLLAAIDREAYRVGFADGSRHGKAVAEVVEYLQPEPDPAPPSLPLSVRTPVNREQLPPRQKELRAVSIADLEEKAAYARALEAELTLAEAELVNQWEGR